MHGTSIVANRPCTFGRAVGKGHTSIHADATINGHAGTVNRGEAVVVVEVDDAIHAGDLAKVDGGEVVVVEEDVASHAGDLAKVDRGEIVVVEVDFATHAGDLAKADGGERVGTEVDVADAAFRSSKTELGNALTVHVYVITIKPHRHVWVSQLNRCQDMPPLTRCCCRCSVCGHCLPRRAPVEPVHQLFNVPLLLELLLDNVDSVQKHAAVRGGVDVHVILVHDVKGTILCLADGSLLFTLHRTCAEPKGEKRREKKEKREAEGHHLLGSGHRGSLFVRVKPGGSK